MHTGMLWFDNSSIPLSAKIEKATEYYEEKYGRKPNLVLVHPSMLDATAPDGMRFESDGLTIRSYRPVLPGHIWIGIQDRMTYSSPAPRRPGPQWRRMLVWLAICWRHGEATELRTDRICKLPKEV